MIDLSHTISRNIHYPDRGGNTPQSDWHPLANAECRSFPHRSGAEIVIYKKAGGGPFRSRSGAISERGEQKIRQSPCLTKIVF